MERRPSQLRARVGAVVLLNSLLGLAASSGFAQRDEVWAMEEKYWQYVQDGDVEKYVSLWHDDFVGWPCSAIHPSRKANIGDWVRAIRDEKIEVTYELNREATEYFGYFSGLHVSTPIVRRHADGTVTGEGRLLKFTHTWMRSGGQWQIITGMCALAALVI